MRPRGRLWVALGLVVLLLAFFMLVTLRVSRSVQNARTRVQATRVQIEGYNTYPAYPQERYAINADAESRVHVEKNDGARHSPESFPDHFHTVPGVDSEVALVSHGYRSPAPKRIIAVLMPVLSLSVLLGIIIRRRRARRQWPPHGF